MSDNPLALLQATGQQALAVPASLQSVMATMQSSELQQNVGVSFAVMSIKGKQFAIRFGGQTTPLTMQLNGQTYAQPYFDVVIPMANGPLSKTYYKDGYADGADDAPTCWSEDGVTPLAPMDQRPLDPRTGSPCVDCRMCPMNVFGSKTTDAGKQAKQCADTRKLIVLPVVPNGQKNPDGSDVTVLDAENIRFGGPMLLRVPAASLKVFADYDLKLQGMGLAYFAVVTRLEFDQTQAYPKFVLKATRVLSEWEGQEVLRVRSSPLVKQILEGGHTASPAASAAVAGVANQSVPASLAQAAAQQVAPAPTQTPPPAQQAPVAPPAPAQPAPVPPAPAQPAPAPSNVVPMHPPAPATAAPVQAAPAPIPQAPVPPPPPPPPAPAAAPFPPEGWLQHPTSPTHYYRGQEVLTEAELRATMLPPQAPPVPPVNAPAVASASAPLAGVPQVTPQLMSAVDDLLK